MSRNAAACGEVTIPIRCGRVGYRLLAFCVEQTFRLKLRLELFESDLQRAGAFGLKIFRSDLQVPALFVDGDASTSDHLHAVLGTKTQQPRLRAKHHRTDLRIPVFQGEVQMAGPGRAEVGDFSFDPNVSIFALDVGADRRDQVAHAPYPAFGGTEAESKLIGGTHGNRSLQERGTAAVPAALRRRDTLDVAECRTR